MSAIDAAPRRAAAALAQGAATRLVRHGLHARCPGFAALLIVLMVAVILGNIVLVRLAHA